MVSGKFEFESVDSFLSLSEDEILGKLIEYGLLESHDKHFSYITKNDLGFGIVRPYFTRSTVQGLFDFFKNYDINFSVIDEGNPEVKISIYKIVSSL